MIRDGRLKIVTMDEIKDTLKAIKRDSRTVVKLRGAGRSALHYWDISCGFDIETTNTRINKDKYSWMYEWTLGIRDYILLGSTWDEFIDTLNLAAEIFDTGRKHLIVYVHNLAHEMSFMKSVIAWDDVFEVEPRKTLRAVAHNGIEFRCSSLLANCELSVVADNLVYHNTKKLKGDLDYSLIRTKDTNLTYQEYQYCINDVQILLDYIDEQRAIYNDIAHIPYTNTGRVREYCRRECLTTVNKEGKTVNNVNYRDLMKKLTLEQEEYDMLHGMDENGKGVFAGGYTHCSPQYNGFLLKNITSYDLTSAYPTVMIAEKYPMSKGYKLPLNEYWMFKNLLNNDKKLLVFYLYIKNLKPLIHYDYYISESKCRRIEGAKVYNGRVVSADYLEVPITSVDYKIMKQCYTWENEGVSDVWVYAAGYLPTPFVKSILKLYKDKTELKGVKEQLANYRIKKEMLNSSYGMTVQKVDNVPEYNRKRNRFLFYPWGVFITAYNRARVWEAILNELKDDYVYTDTDSVKCFNGEAHRQWFINNNEAIRAKLYRALDYHKLPHQSVEPSTIKGVPKLLGAWDFEGTYRQFKSLGAKRYLVEAWNEDDQQWEFELTNAGVKKNAVTYLGDNPFKNYKLGLEIPKEHSGKLCHTYIDIPRECDVTDYQGHTCHIKELSSCHLEPVAYKLGDNDDLVKMLDYLRGVRNDL